MNFFKSILSEDPDPLKPENLHKSDPNSPRKSPHDDSDSGDAADRWSFGGLIKNLAIDSVIETYRKDLQEFGSGLKKETEILRETASRAVKDLPASIEASASAAQGALDGVLKSTAEIISKESLFSASDGESETPGTNRSFNSSRYSWFDSQLGAIQSDSATFCEDPEDSEEYKKWKLGFELEKKRDEIDILIGENGNLESAYKRLVPNAVDPEAFWSRYFYRVEKLKQQESVRANLVKRAISVDDEEELSWDVDDDDDDDNARDVSVGDSEKSNLVESKGIIVDSSLADKEVKSEVVAEVKTDEKVKSENEKSDEKVSAEEKVSDQPKAKDEDLEWDEIEDIGSGDEKKVESSGQSGSPNRTELKKRLSSVENDDDDDDLSWDIEDDEDEPVKKA
ncbi:bsd domain-containing protein 1 [Phtheirospermum japonicum]|uniref:Bsd domain-containing protein 1 n=1 Tax=Phtheirospermum japonicum TaxID=374723 RepID=A0A830CFN6_9LAMI|nr:bsd domain-containing protein 1 [Phtheirospermum japonicum]